jgi:predicted dehydrogenase
MTSTSRRNFLKTTGLITASTALIGAGAPKIHAASDNTIRIGLVGCGGRGRGAAIQALRADDLTELVAVGDAFQDRAQGYVAALANDASVASRVKVGDKCFGDLDNYKKVIDALSPGDAVILASPPAFRPLHFEYAVNRGLHIFAEKPLAVDTPGCNRILKANELAKQKGLKCAVGLMMRHHKRTAEIVKAIQDGVIGDIIACNIYRKHGEMFPSFRFPQDATPLHKQLIGFQGFRWGNGGFCVDWLIHTKDVVCWARGDYENAPIASVFGIGGRSVRTANDQLFDHADYEYQFADGVKMTAQLQHINGTHYYGGAWMFGTKGVARLGEGIMDPKIYKGLKEVKANVIWQPEAKNNDHYQEEHNRFYAAIRNNENWNEIDRGVEATLVSLMGRYATDSGLEVSYEAAKKSEYVMAPGLDTWNLQSEAPVKPDENDSYVYTIAKPGTTKEF